MKTYVPETLITNIDIPPSFVRSQKSPAEDKALNRSIRQGGIFDPVILIRNGPRFTLVKGSRRIEQAKAIGLPKVPYIAYELPKGEGLNTHALRLRMTLMDKRIDLLPSQRAKIVKGMQDNNASMKAIADHLGVDIDTIGNWLAVLNYIPKVATAIDEGKLTMQSARVFVGMTPVGQETVWRLHGEELRAGQNVEQTRIRLRAQYPPEKFPHFYKNAEVVKERMRRQKGKRRVMKAPTATEAEKKKMLTSYDIKEEEQETLDEDNQVLRKRIDEAVPVVAAILANEHIRKKIPAPVLAELEEFARAYVED